MYQTRAVTRHILLSVSFAGLFLLLNRPEVILLSRLGSTAWYPATGLLLALLLIVSPWYGLLGCLLTELAAAWIYHQPWWSFGGTVGATALGGFYTAAAFVLRGPLRIDLGLRQRRDVIRYLWVTSAAALGSTIIGVACLAADRSIPWSEYWRAALTWFLGDETGILSITPFLLLHLFPRIRRQALLHPSEAPSPKPNTRAWGWKAIVEATGQVAALVAVLWVMFGDTFRQSELYYLSFVPIIWIAMRHGIRRVTTGLLVLNVGIAVWLRHLQSSESLLHKAGLLMFVVSAAGLIVGAAVSERHRIAVELFERTSELKAVNRQLLTSKVAADSANHAKSEFLAMISHEIRTPINGVLGMAELALDTDLTSEQRDYLVTLKSSADSLLRIVNDVLDFSKIESGHLELSAVEFDLWEVVGNTVRMLAHRAEEKGLELAYRIDPAIPEIVVGDVDRLRQILVNLLGNAIKFTHRGEILAQVACITNHEHELNLHFSVADTGIGIAPEKHRHIFEAFAQADGSTTRDYGGTGLGLAICERLVRLMGGTIWVESVLEKGSTFHFMIQVRVAEQQRSTSPNSLEAKLAGTAVLLAEGNARNRQILVEICNGWAMRPIEADSVAGAIAAIEAARNGGYEFRVVLIDSDLPGVDGFGLAELLQRNSVLTSRIIICLKSTNQHADLARYQKLGLNLHLVKPIQKPELLSAISTALSGPEVSGTFRPARALPWRASSHPLRILVAEDNPLNQKVVSRMLEKMGHLPKIAENGNEALRLLNIECFDLVLMDVQMPELDGLTTTLRIRQKESKKNRIPIIAMTAHAMTHDRPQCLASGMDAYLTKPLNSQQLRDAIDSWFGPSKDSKAIADTQRPQSYTRWDPVPSLARVDGDVKLLCELVEIFLDECPKQLVRLQQAIGNKNAELMERIAHSIKSEAGYLGLRKAFELSAQLEQMGRNSQLDLAMELFDALEAEILALAPEMRSLYLEEIAKNRAARS
jgi:signal transduction histidine kinase/DNA-binding response OmpR family regulator/HPt (histidine-containing phosphotransfer) domain-containing protein